jgi:hypothetical protein
MSINVAQKSMRLNAQRSKEGFAIDDLEVPSAVATQLKLGVTQIT